MYIFTEKKEKKQIYLYLLKIAKCDNDLLMNLHLMIKLDFHLIILHHLH